MIRHLANECRELHCSRCQENGHLSWDCTSIKRCVHCHQPSKNHSDTTCQEIKSARVASQKCNICDDEGHVSKDCTKCKTCKEDGHIATECPTKRPNPDACKRCRSGEHQTAECPETIQCTKCAVWGHDSTGCTAKPRAKRTAGNQAQVKGSQEEPTSANQEGPTDTNKEEPANAKTGKTPFLPVKTRVSKTTNADSTFDMMTNLFQQGSFDEDTAAETDDAWGGSAVGSGDVWGSSAPADDAQGNPDKVATGASDW